MFNFKNYQKMAVVFENKDAYAGRVYCFHTPPTKLEVFGYKVNGVAKGDVIPQGTPLVADDETRTATICKHAKVVKKVDAKTFIVEDLGFLAVGDKLFCSGETAPVLSEIADIDKTAKKIVFKANNAQVAVGKILVEGVTEGENVVAKDCPNRIVARTETMKTIDHTISATYQAAAIKNVLDYPVEWLNTTTYPGTVTLKGCPLIVFFKQ